MQKTCVLACTTAARSASCTIPKTNLGLSTRFKHSVQAARAQAAMADLFPPPKELEKPMDFPRKLLMGPGPSNAPPRILAAAALPLLGHMHSDFHKIMDDVKVGIKYAFQTQNEVTLAISGAGMAAMETVCCNMIEPGDVVFVAINGVWGERFADISERHGAVVKTAVVPYGEAFSLSTIEKALKEHRPSLMFVPQGDSSGGVLQRLDEMGHLCHRYGCLLAVDSVASLGGVPLHMDKWGIDILYTGSQKVLNGLPGISPISFSPAAWQKVLNRKTKVRSFYLDLTWLANYWGCDGKPRQYHHTAPISNMYALREALAILAEEGLESYWERHKECAALLQKGLEDMGLQLFVKDPSARLPTVTSIAIPAGIDYKQVTDYAMRTYHMEIAGGLGGSVGKVFRIGLMGYNATPDNVAVVLKALGEGLQWAKNNAGAKI